MKTLLLLASMMMSVAHAAGGGNDVPFIAEIYGGWDSGKLAATTTGGSSQDATTSGLAGGVRGGILAGPFLIGVDGGGTIGRADFSNAALTDGDWKKTFVYGMIGFNFDRVRLWGGYAVQRELTLTQTLSSVSIDTKYTGGTAVKGVVSFQLLDQVAVNGEYYVNKPDTIQILGASGKVKDSYSKFEESGFLITISYVLNKKK